METPERLFGKTFEFAQGSAYPPDLDLPEDLSVVDIQQNIFEFHLDHELAREIGLGIPYFRAGDEKIYFGLDLLAYRLRHDLVRLWELRAGYLFRREVSGWDSPDEAFESFRKGAIRFIQARLEGLPYKPDRATSATLSMPRFLGQSPSSVSGATVTVSTDSAGLSVVRGDAYRTRTTHGYTFGHPTSPVSGVLQAGRYVFGVEGGAYNSVEWDSKIFALPGPTASHHIHK